jgi:ABC-type spermidine/putrescine transport system permease subunit II
MPPRRKDWAKDIWVARDQYRLETFLLGCLTLVIVVPLVVVVCALLSYGR